MISYCKEILHGTFSAREVNETILVLTPKSDKPKDMTQYRPISLCRVLYKVVAKAWANRLKLLLSRCISLNQNAFVPGRMIHNNFLIAHELLHYLQSSKNGPNKGFVSKLDMSKAYDRVEWMFLKCIILCMGFANKLVAKIMDCVRSVRYVVKCNFTLSETITPQQGFRQ